MTAAQKIAAQHRYQREGEAICPCCEGTGRILSPSIRQKARKGGHSSFLKSLQPGEMTMSARGARGGRPKEVTIDELSAIRQRGRSAREPFRELAPESTDAPVTLPHKNEKLYQSSNGTGEQDAARMTPTPMGIAEREDTGS